MIQTEPTPNPNSLKFLSDFTISEVGNKEFQKKEIKNLKNPFVIDLLNIEGVELILLSENFLTVKKKENIPWSSLKPTIISFLNDFRSKNKLPVLSIKDDLVKDEKSNDDEDEVVSKIKEVLDTKIRPAVARDGGDIKFKSFNNGRVTVELQGSCSGCPSSLMTLKQGVQNLLCHYVKEVKSVEAS